MDTPVCRELPPSECRRMLEEEPREACMVLDVRTGKEFREGHLAGARNVDFYAPAFRDQLAGLDRNKKYLVYCRTGVRGARAMEMMRQLGFRHVTNIRGGFTGWTAAGLPAEK